MNEEVDVVKKERDDLKIEVEHLKAQLSEHLVCKRCGRADKTSPVKIREDIKQKYFRSMLGQVPFTHTITALGGKLSATFMMQRGDVLTSMSQNSDDTNDGDGMKRMIVSTLTSVKVVDPVTEVEKPIYTRTPEQLSACDIDVTKLYDEFLKCVDIVQLAFVRTACGAFTLLVHEMIEEISSEDFFIGAGLL